MSDQESSTLKLRQRHAGLLERSFDKFVRRDGIGKLVALIAMTSLHSAYTQAQIQPRNGSSLQGTAEIRPSDTYALVANYTGTISTVPSVGQLYRPQESEGSKPFLTLSSPKESEQLRALSDQLTLVDTTLRRRGYQALGERDDFDGSLPWKYANKSSAVKLVDQVPSDFFAALGLDEALKVHSNLRDERFKSASAPIKDNDEYIQKLLKAIPNVMQFDRPAAIELLDETLTNRIRDAFATGHIGIDLPTQMTARANGRKLVRLNGLSLLRDDDIDVPSHLRTINQPSPYPRMVIEIPWDRSNGITALQRYWDLIEQYDLYDESDRKLIYRILDQASLKPDWVATRALFVKLLAQDLQQYSQLDSHVNFVVLQFQDLQPDTLRSEKDFLSLHVGERLDNSDVIDRPCRCFPDGAGYLTLAEQKQKDVYVALQSHLQATDPILRLSNDEIASIGATFVKSQEALLLARGPTQKVTPPGSAEAQVIASDWVNSTSRQAALLTRYNRSITRDFAGKVLMILEQRPTLLIGGYNPFNLSSDLPQKAAAITSDAGPAAPFERAELEAALSFATFMPKMDYLHFDDLLKMQSYVLSRMELDMAQRADELRIYGGQLLTDYNRTLSLFNDGSIYTADVAEAKQVFVENGRAVQQGAKLASVTPSYERILEFTPSRGQALPPSLSLGDRLSFQLRSNEPLPLSGKQIEALNKDSDRQMTRQLLVALNQLFLSSTTITGDLRQSSVKDGMTTLTVFISLPSTLRCLSLPKTGVGGLALSEIAVRLSRLSIILKDEKGGSCLPLDGGFLKIGGSYTAKLVL